MLHDSKEEVYYQTRAEKFEDEYFKRIDILTKTQYDLNETLGLLMTLYPKRRDIKQKIEAIIRFPLLKMTPFTTTTNFRDSKNIEKKIGKFNTELIKWREKELKRIRKTYEVKYSSSFEDLLNEIERLIK